MAYRMTGARQRALRKAQLISAQKRKRRFGFGGTKKMSKGQKRAVAIAAAGAVVMVGGVYGTSAWMNHEQRKAKVKAMKAYRDQARWNVNARRLTRSPNMSRSRNLYKDAFTGDLIQVQEDGDNATAPSQVVRATRGVKVTTKVKNPYAQAIMGELHGTQVPGRPKSAKYKVIFGE